MLQIKNNLRTGRLLGLIAVGHLLTTALNQLGRFILKRLIGNLDDPHQLGLLQSGEECTTGFYSVFGVVFVILCFRNNKTLKQVTFELEVSRFLQSKVNERKTKTTFLL